MVFSVAHRETLENVQMKWLNEFRQHSEARFILVGNKTDLRENMGYDDDLEIREVDEDEEDELDSRDYAEENGAIFNDLDGEDDEFDYVTFEEGRKVAVMMGAERYMECSCLKNSGVEEVFQEVARLGIVAVEEIKSAIKSSSRACVLL